MTLTQIYPSKRKPREEKRPSCNGCRAQKLRCDAYLHDFQTCSRCRKQKLECIVPPHHIKMRSSEGSSKNASEALPNSPSSLNKTWAAKSPYTSHSPFATPSNSIREQSVTMQPDLPMIRANIAPASSTKLPTQPRILDGYQVNGNIVDACFLQYVFEHIF